VHAGIALFHEQTPLLDLGDAGDQLGGGGAFVGDQDLEVAE
jgi:hypothetical protein